ncbi:HPr(Ser) kinase/phosphatase [Phocicoccus pinnipedialis]|uniref:HPr kinase/phosphorylase n=1 Tax=Phocicoccus pinnipedialis TaxID=110845 RepID=A0A6V7R2L6_9BACL|nr:HPr(Ser) kinase/phosphatase [Jeotgalicoccus pinnipedialis]MBP1938793.1 HPr kinase/phosphorylase [Jeotgalicoccus pinnipedialis]CAD2071567.1 HPr kinase/phosphorylase [Jeotgalicoccus pinnipedialis]
MIIVRDILEKFDLTLHAGSEGLNKEIVSIDVSRPGLEVAGYFSHYSSERIQIFGTTETTFFMHRLTDEEQESRAHSLCRKDTPCIILTHGHVPPEALIKACDKTGTALLSTRMTTTGFNYALTDYLEMALAPETNVHGVLLDVYGIGVLITGESGIGKSEIALELVKNGHRLVADDNVEIKQIQKDQLIGKAPKLIENLLEIRGIGIVNVMTLFGAGVVLNEKRIMLNVHLEFWNKNKEYDRVGLEERSMKILDTEVSQKLIPVRPGRNLVNIIEVAAMNFRLQKMGINAAEEFNERLKAFIRQKSGGETRHDI